MKYLLILAIAFIGCIKKADSVTKAAPVKVTYYFYCKNPPANITYWGAISGDFKTGAISKLLTINDTTVNDVISSDDYHNIHDYYDGISSIYKSNTNLSDSIHISAILHDKTGDKFVSDFCKGWPGATITALIQLSQAK